MNFIGIDLHSNRFNICALSSKNQTFRKTFNLKNEEQMTEFFSFLSTNDHVAFEASTNSFAFNDLLVDKVKKVYVLDPFQFKLICKSGKKNDKIDASKIVTMLKYHVESKSDFLPLVYVPDLNIRKIRSLFTTYKLLKKQIVATKNRIHSILKQNLHPYNNQDIYGSTMREEILNLDINEEDLIQISILYNNLDALETNANKIKKIIIYSGKDFEHPVDILTSISGVSVFIALAIIGDYANNIKRFKNAKHFSSYMRSVPKLDASNKSIKNGNTHKQGRKTSISLILQSLQHILNIDPYLFNYYKRKTMGVKKGKMRMAIARRIFVRIFFILKNNEYYKYRNSFQHERKMKEFKNIINKYEK